MDCEDENPFGHFDTEWLTSDSWQMGEREICDNCVVCLDPIKSKRKDTWVCRRCSRPYHIECIIGEDNYDEVSYQNWSYVNTGKGDSIEKKMGDGCTTCYFLKPEYISKVENIFQ